MEFILSIIAKVLNFLVNRTLPAVIVLVILVQLFQSVGTKLATKCDKRLKGKA